MTPSAKRRKIDVDENGASTSTNGISRLDISKQHPNIKSLARHITPPATNTRTSVHVHPASPVPRHLQNPTSVRVERGNERERENIVSQRARGAVSASLEKGLTILGGQTYLPSPFRLSRVRNLPKEANVNSVGLHDLLGDPLIRECWLFDYLFDIDFVMAAFDPDIRHIVQVKIVHGSWKREDGHRIRLAEQAERYPNVNLICAHMPEAFGTHHSKMMILLRHDDTAQVIIHTANMVRQDWANLTQGLWISPQLPKISVNEESDAVITKNGTQTGPRGWRGHAPYPIGSGNRFKIDLHRYLAAYEGRTKSLVQNLNRYDFADIRAAFIASAPCRQPVKPHDSNEATSWGWLGLREALSQIPCRKRGTINQNATSSNAIQVSSVATLTEKWLDNFFDVLATRQAGPASNPLLQSRKPEVSIIFPTAREVRCSLDGYASGSSIHWRLQSAAQQKQFALLKPRLHRWTNLSPDDLEVSIVDPDITLSPSSNAERHATPPYGSGNARRSLAAPHIKTYIRFSDASKKTIDWALLTSANLSQQAWGALPSASAASSSSSSTLAKAKTGEQTIRICSYEVGVLVWPALFADEENEDVEMVPVFGKDEPTPEDDVAGAFDTTAAKKIVALRIPYSLPLTPYTNDEVPWCAGAVHRRPDRFNRVWGVEEGGGGGGDE